VATISFEERVLEAEVPDPAAGGEWRTTQLRWRRDPLTGRSARILTGVKLQPDARPDLSELVARPAFCPFCEQWLEQATATFPTELSDEGRIRVGRAIVVPNILAYATHSAVGIYDSGRHFLDLDELTADVIGDALAAMVRHARAVRRMDPTAQWGSINANYLPPSGSSLVHPHLQSAHDACGTTAQRTLVDRAGAWPGRDSYFQTLVEQERDGPRWIGETGGVAWLAPFAPTGFHEVWGIVAGMTDVVELGTDETDAFGSGLARVLGAYRAWNLTSFNFALLGGGGGSDGRFRVLLKVVSRSNAEPMYRSDATFFERLHDEAMIDLAPEEVAAAIRSRR
jgi:UDPglucose--hexose-1-phosphate uridylyltransferase